ncbi:hypothetical protein ABG768_019025 [Culter alburnus]|uniref:Uncharacterized protein n=1 Tax=Culter alburnus TaxID=194366 RepID=A0AAW2AWT9_CULAL
MLLQQSVSVLTNKVKMARKRTREDILDLIFDSDAESDSGSDSLSDSNEEAHLPENLAGCDRSEEPAIPVNDDLDV